MRTSAEHTGPYLVFASRPPENSYEAARDGEPELFTTRCGGTREIRPGEHPAFGRGRPVADTGQEGRDGRAGRDGSSSRSDATTAAATLDVLRDLLGWLTPAVGHVLDAVDRTAALAAGPDRS